MLKKQEGAIKLFQTAKLKSSGIKRVGCSIREKNGKINIEEVFGNSNTFRTGGVTGRKKIAYEASVSARIRQVGTRGRRGKAQKWSYCQ